MDLSEHTILIADDNAQNVELLEAFVAPLGVRVVTACDGEEAVSVAMTEKVDLVLLDIMMPRASGYQVCQRLRAEPSTKSMKVLMVSALGAVNDIERANEVGADGMLTKPVNREELIDAITRLLAG